jgi:hypothetical protein
MRSSVESRNLRAVLIGWGRPQAFARCVLRLVLVVTTLLRPSDGQAWSVPTHQRLSARGIEQSNLTSQNDASNRIWTSMGLRPLAQENLGVYPGVVADMITQGAALEDSPPWNVFNHFWDPYNDRPLDAAFCNLVLPGGCWRSVEWALEAGNNGPLIFQSYSLRDARDVFASALTAPTKALRDVEFLKAFNILGHVIHHVQDMTQPEHTRIETHLLGSVYEDYASGCDQVILDNSPPYLPDFSAFDTPRNYWATKFPMQLGGKGIAEFSNQNFLTIGTNFTGTVNPTLLSLNATPNAAYPSPNPSGALVAQPTLAQLIDELKCTKGVTSNSLGTTKESFVTKNVTDPVTGETWTQYTSAFGLYGGDLGANSPAAFSLNIFNYAYAVERLLPRAAGYSAGLLDHFFRGMAFAGQPGLRFQAFNIQADFSQPPFQGSYFQLINNTPYQWSDGSTDPESGSLEIWYDDRNTGMRRQLGGEGGAVPIAVGPRDTSSSQVIVPIDLTELASQGPINGEVVVLYKGKIGNDDLGISARVCKCPWDPDDPDPFAAECAQLCPCRWLSFLNGDPKKPGEVDQQGELAPVTVQPEMLTPDEIASGVNREHFLFDSCFEMSTSQLSMTLTLFPDPLGVGTMTDGEITLMLGNVDPSLCGTACQSLFDPVGLTSAGGRRSGLTTYNSIPGFYHTITKFTPFGHNNYLCDGQEALTKATGVNVCFTSNGSCQGQNNCCTRLDLDAAMICFGPDAYPQDP